MFEELDLKIGESAPPVPGPNSFPPTEPNNCPSRPLCTHTCTCGIHCTETC